MINFLADKISDRFSAKTMAKWYSTTSPKTTDSLALHRFRKTVRWAGTRSAFYRKAFAERGIDPAKVRTPADLGDFYTTPDDVAHRAEELICQPPAIVFESSGTSGRNKQIYFTKDELASMGETQAAGLYLMGLTPQDRVANAFDFSIWIPGLLSHYGLMSAGTFCQAFGKCDPSEVYRRLGQYKFTCVIGEPTWLIRLTELAERDGCPTRPGCPTLKLLIGGAEEMPADAIPWMNRVWGGAKVKMCYGTVEQGHAMAFQPCDVPEGYHLDTVDFLPELIEPDADGYGELIFTTLRRRTMPLIRYRTRDVTRFVKQCPCGLRTPRIERLRGRRDELIVASGGNLYPLMFQNMLADVPGITHDFQVIFKLAGVREVMEINVESDRADHDALFDQIKQQATEKYPDLMKNLALGIFEMTLVVRPPGTLRTARKLKRLIDRRHYEPGASTQAEPVEKVEQAVGV